MNEDDLKFLKELKERVIRNQQYTLAAHLRGTIKEVEEHLNKIWVENLITNIDDSETIS